MTICLGLVCSIFLGGIFNLLVVAYAVTLDVVMATGIAMAAFAIGVAWRNRIVSGNSPAIFSSREWLMRSCPGALLLLAVFIFKATYLTPPTAFNVHDDFSTYLALPLRMLETGTLRPGIFSNFGINTLGGQAFLQAFVAAHWPVAFVDAVDAYFGLILTGTLVLVGSRRMGVPSWLTPLAVVAVILVNPQYVNVSTLYIGSALLMFLLFLDMGVCKDKKTCLNLTSKNAAIVTGMTYAALVALKSTFVLLVLVHFVLTTISACSATRNVRDSLVWVGYVVLSGACLLAPWILVQVDKIFSTIVSLMQGIPKSMPGSPVVDAAKGVDIFSTEPFIYGFGAGYAQYTALAGFALICAIVLASRAYQCRRLHDAPIMFRLAGFLTLPAFLLIQMLIVSPMMGYDTALRYAAPAFIAIVPAAVVLAGPSLVTRSENEPPTRKQQWISISAIAVPLVCIIWAFSGSFVHRIKQATEYGSMLSFLYFANPEQKGEFFRYNKIAFLGLTRDRFAEIQIQVPPGRSILSYVSSSFYFDYSRNRILSVDTGGLGAPWLNFPFDGSIDAATQFLRERDAEYVLWEYRGYAVPARQTLRAAENFPSASDRERARKQLAFIDFLLRLSERSEVLYDDGSYRLLVIR